MSNTNVAADCPDCGGQPTLERQFLGSFAAFCDDCGWPYPHVMISTLPDTALSEWYSKASFEQNAQEVRKFDSGLRSRQKQLGADISKIIRKNADSLYSND